jgi:hypothetical protein
VTITVEQAELIRKIARARIDFPYFCAHFVRILTKHDGLMPLILKHSQLILWDLIQRMVASAMPLRIVILKARQMGISTMIQAYLFWRALTDPGSGQMVIAHDAESTSELFGKIELMRDQLADVAPLWFDQLNLIKDTAKKGNKLAWKSPLNTSLTVQTAGNKKAGRSRTLKRVHVSELGFWEYADQIMFGLAQAVGRGTSTEIFVESTGNGIGNYLHRMWKRSGKLLADGSISQGESNYVGVFLPWYWEPGYRSPAPKGFRPTADELKLMQRFKLDYQQLQWRREVIADECDGDVDLFRQEYPGTPDEAFLVTGKPYFGKDELEHYRAQIKNPIRAGSLEIENGVPTLHDMAVDDLEAPWRIWAKPVQGRPYIIGGDVAGGTSEDFSTACVLDARTLEVVATYRDKLDPDDFARQLKWMAITYNYALIACEKNSEGIATVLKLNKGLGYTRQFHHQHDEQWGGGVQSTWGWRTSSRSRPIALSDTKALMRQRLLKLYDERFVRELESFVRVPGAKIATAQEGMNDDCVMCLCIAANNEVREQGSFTVKGNSESRRHTVGVGT